MNWEEYLTKTVELYRQEFKKLNPEIQEMIREKNFDDTLLKPCQIEVLVSPGEVGCLVIHDKQLDDMEIKIQKNCRSYDDSEFIKKYSFKLLQLKPQRKLLSQKWIAIWTREQRFVERDRPTPEILVRTIFISLELFTGEEIREKQVGTIRESTNEIMNSIAKLPDDETKSELIIPAKKIDKALEKIKQLDDKISKVRQLVGVSEEYQDWKLLVSDVDRLKGEHVPREILDTEVRRIDEKIDKGLKALNTRIEDLKAIKFWSKRTLLEIALAIMAVIATLYGAGVIKF